MDSALASGAPWFSMTTNVRGIKARRTGSSSTTRPPGRSRAHDRGQRLRGAEFTLSVRVTLRVVEPQPDPPVLAVYPQGWKPRWCRGNAATHFEVLEDAGGTVLVYTVSTGTGSRCRPPGGATRANAIR